MAGLEKGDQLVDRPDQLGPLKDAGRHVPAEDEAELFLVQPLALDVVDLELYVGGHKGGHVGAEVVPDDLEKAVSSVFAWEARSTLEGPLRGGNSYRCVGELVAHYD